MERGEWDELSEHEREALILSERFEMLKEHQGKGEVIFGDILTPTLYPDDPDRESHYIGALLEVGEDEAGPWALINVTVHQIQMTSIEAVSPGFRGFNNSMNPEITDLADSFEAVQGMAEAYPETDIYLDLPIAPQPQKFYVSVMVGCIVGLQN